MICIAICALMLIGCLISAFQFVLSLRDNEFTLTEFMGIIVHIVTTAFVIALMEEIIKWGD